MLDIVYRKVSSGSPQRFLTAEVGVPLAEARAIRCLDTSNDTRATHRRENNLIDQKPTPHRSPSASRAAFRSASPSGRSPSMVARERARELGATLVMRHCTTDIEMAASIHSLIEQRVDPIIIAAHGSALPTLSGRARRGHRRRHPIDRRRCAAALPSRLPDSLG